ncbi:MAG: DMT family transporter [Sporolactobacillus sp.]
MFFLIALAILSISTAAIFVRLTDAPAPVLAGYRLLFAALLLLPLLLRGKRWRELAALTVREWLFATLCGLLLAAHYTLWFSSLRLTSVASSTVLVSLQPLFAFAGGSLLFNERLPLRAFVGAGMALAGSVLIGWQDWHLSIPSLAGDGLALLAAAMIAGYFLIGQALRQKLSLVPYSIIGYATSAGLLFLDALVQRLPLFSYTPADWLMFLGLALIPTVVGLSIFNWLVRWSGASLVSVSILGEPVGTSLLAWLILHQSMTLRQLVGLCVILAGMTLFLFSKDKPQTR